MYQIKNCVILAKVVILLVVSFHESSGQNVGSCKVQLDALLLGVDKQEPWAVISMIFYNGIVKSFASLANECFSA